MKISSIIKYSLSLVLAVLLFYFAFRNVSVDEFLDKVSEVNYWWVILSILLSLMSHWLRAYRWNLMLKPLGYDRLSDGRTFLAVMTGYLANLAFPRLGEVTRCGVMKKNEKIPMSISFGTVITERTIDFLILLSLIILDFIIEFDRVYDFFITAVGWDTQVDHTMYIILISSTLVALGVIGILILKRILEHEFENSLLQKIHRVLTDIVNGLLSIRKVQNIFGFVASTIGIWVFYYLMSFVIFFSIGETSGLGFGAGLSILAAAGVAMAMPVQGGIGAYHTLVSGVLIIYGIEATTGLFFATLLHTSQLICILLFGGLSVLGTVFINRKRKTEMAS
ncbi:lysylphosphatidylglycerol synthase transmembrane domain-containing protein [Reichenbachiella sp.]|uniref:lysylphosphatidylglycerol synthase transmembrane domain-containing protein n=1 Tax=Reichenbachiella sp. TaxID=2184521 RepID=UPI003B5A1EF9